MPVSFPELDELEGKITKCLKDAGDFTEQAKSDDGVLDLKRVTIVGGTNLEKAAWFQEQQKELSDLHDQAEPLRAIKRQSEGVLELRGHDGAAERGDIADRYKSTKSLGQRFNDSRSDRPSLKQFRHEYGDADPRSILVKTTMSTSAGWAPDVIRGPRVVDYATPPIEILDFIPMVPTSQTSVAFMEETTFTNAAAERSEGAAKAESTLVLTERTSAVRSIATSMGVTDEQLEDVDRIDAYLNNRLPFMLRQRLEGQVLTGDGSAPNLRGILNVSGIQTQAKGSDPTPDAVYKAMVLVMTTGDARPDAVVFNPLDWQDVRLLRTSDGIYIWGSPADPGPERIWGLPVLLSQRETQGTAIVGAFKAYSEIDVKKGITIERGFINDDFTKDITRLRAEIRAAFVVYRPAAFCTVTGV